MYGAWIRVFYTACCKSRDSDTVTLLMTKDSLEDFSNRNAREKECSSRVLFPELTLYVLLHDMHTLTALPSFMELGYSSRTERTFLVYYYRCLQRCYDKFAHIYVANGRSSDCMSRTKIIGINYRRTHSLVNWSYIHSQSSSNWRLRAQRFSSRFVQF